MSGAHTDDVASADAPGPQAPCDAVARRVIRELLDGGGPDGRLDECGHWADTVVELHEAHGEGGTVAVRAVWKTLSRRNADLIRLVSAGDDGPLAGAGEGAVRILMEGTESAPPLLPPIDHVRQLHELEKFVLNPGTARLSSRSP